MMLPNPSIFSLSLCHVGDYRDNVAYTKCPLSQWPNPMKIVKLIAASALLLSGELAAQTFKCTSATGKITYSGTKCSELGLKDAGEVKDRLNVNPAYRPPVRAIESPPSPSPAAKAPNAETPAAGAEPAEPERRCFSVRTAKGNVTRCNEKSDE